MEQLRKSSRWILGALLLSVVMLLQPVWAEYRKPKPEVASRVALGQGLNGGDLERVKIGHQAGVLKVVGGDNSTVKFIKGKEGIFGIDGREWAPLSSAQRDQIVSGLGIKDPDAMASSLMNRYTTISRAHALAILGVLAYPGEKTPSLKPELRTKTLQFFRNRLQPAEDNIVRRQAVLALAIQPKTDAETVASMLNFLRRDHNAWNTFGVVQFFEYHRGQIRLMPGFQGYLTQLNASGSPHAEQIVALLKTLGQNQPPSDPALPSQPDPVPQPSAPLTKPSPVPMPLARDVPSEFNGLQEAKAVSRTLIIGCDLVTIGNLSLSSGCV